MPKQDDYQEIDLRLNPGKAPLYQRLAESIRDRVATGLLSPGNRLPPIRRLARQLKIHTNTVARAYAELEREGVLTTRRGGGTTVSINSEDPLLSALRTERLRSIISKAALEALSLGYEPAQIEKAMSHHLATYLKSPAEPTAPEPLVIYGSDDPALGLLVNRLSRMSDQPTPILSVHAGSMGGLLAVARGEAHMAGVHLWDAEQRTYNTPFVKRMFPDRSMVLVNLAHRELGLMIHQRSAESIDGLKSLIEQDLVLVNRQSGSGTRLILDYELKQRNITPSQVKGYDHEVNDHFSVAECVANRDADIGIGTLTAARALGLKFIPIRHERYDLVIPYEWYRSELLTSFLTILHSDQYRDAINHLGGYDTSQTGDVVARLFPVQQPKTLTS